MDNRASSTERAGWEELPLHTRVFLAREGKPMIMVVNQDAIRLGKFPFGMAPLWSVYRNREGTTAVDMFYSPVIDGRITTGYPFQISASGALTIYARFDPDRPEFAPEDPLVITYAPHTWQSIVPYCEVIDSPEDIAKIDAPEEASS